jgi:hypothetical protein
MTARIDPLVALDLAQTAAASVIAQITEGDWNRPTPCDEWSVRDVVNKMTASTITFTYFGRRERPNPPLDLIHPTEILGDDPVGAYEKSAAECRAVWRGPGALEGTAPSTVGEFPAKSVLNARIFDTTILTWDVATACGLAHGIHDPLAAYVLRVAKALVPTVRSVSTERYKEPTEPGETAPLVQQMIAATGRDPFWTPPR